MDRRTPTNIVFLTLLYNDLRVVIPAKAGIQIENTGWIPDQVRNDKMYKVFSETVH